MTKPMQMDVADVLILLWLLIVCVCVVFIIIHLIILNYFLEFLAV